jgi:Tol biopolymer transport system component
VVHRDIKPENVLLTGRHALVADFGVAKAVHEATGRQALTTAGVALGTPTYMAPEQAAASPHVDHRADIYALGVMAYEMLTGQPPFTAATPQALLAAHVTEPPLDVTQRRATIPAPLAQLIMRCLAKKAADRPQTADELLPVLESFTTPSGGITPTQTQPVQTLRGLPRWVPWVGGVAALAVVALVVSQFLIPKPLQIALSDVTQVTSEPGVEFEPAISPDGQEVAYVAGPLLAPHLVIRATANAAGGGQVGPADTSLQREGLPSWSPNGDFVRFAACRADGCSWNETGKLGGAVRPVRLPRRAQMRTAVAWSPDGSRVAFVVRDTIYASAATDTVAQRVAVHTVNFWAIHSLAWSPDGRRIAYVNGNPEWVHSGNVAESSIWIVDADGGTPRGVVTNDHNLNASPVWLDPRHLLFVSNRDHQLGAYVVEVGPEGARGEPRAIPGVADPHSISYSIGARTLAWAKFALRQNIWAFPLAGSTPVSIRSGVPVTSGSQVIEEHDVSPDGRWLAFDSKVRGSMDLYRMPLGGGDAVAVTSDSGDEYDPRWSPDGKELAFWAGPEIRVLPAAGGTPTVVTGSPGSFSDYPQWSPSGLDIAFLSTRTGRSEVWVVSRDRVGGAWHQAVQLTDFHSALHDWTPDGRGVLCSSWDGAELIVVSRDQRVLWRHNLLAVSGLKLVWNFELPPGAQYSRDGRTIYLAATHRDGRSGIWAVPAAGGPARLVVASDDPSMVLTGPLSVGPNRLYLTVSQYESDIWVANLRW